MIGDKTVLMMANHGVATVGKTVAEAYDRLYYVERVAQVQLYAMSTGRPLKFLPEDVIETTFAQYRKGETYGGRKPCEWHFDALKRMLDKTRARLQGLIGRHGDPRDYEGRAMTVMSSPPRKWG